VRFYHWRAHFRGAGLRLVGETAPRRQLAERAPVLSMARVSAADWSEWSSWRSASGQWRAAVSSCRLECNPIWRLVSTDCKAALLLAGQHWASAPVALVSRSLNSIQIRARVTISQIGDGPREVGQICPFSRARSRPLAGSRVTRALITEARMVRLCARPSQIKGAGCGRRVRAGELAGA